MSNLRWSLVVLVVTAIGASLSSPSFQPRPTEQETVQRPVPRIGFVEHPQVGSFVAGTVEGQVVGVKVKKLGEILKDSGLQIGDLIVTIGETQTVNSRDFVDAFCNSCRDRSPGKAVVWRDAQYVEIDFKIGLITTPPPIYWP